jgi:general secretion pathway protein G
MMKPPEEAAMVTRVEEEMSNWALVHGMRRRALARNGAGGAAGVGPHSELASVGAGAAPPQGKRRRALARAVTLVEVLIVVAIMSLIATTVVVAVIPKFQQAQNDTALQSAREIRSAVTRWRASRGGTDCPTVSQLVADKEIDTASKVDDPWGSQFKIACTDDEVTVTSAGRDKKENTADDLSVPKAAAAAAP